MIFYVLRLTNAQTPRNERTKRSKVAYALFTAGIIMSLIYKVNLFFLTYKTSAKKRDWIY